MVNTKKNLRMRTLRRLGKYKWKLFVVFLLVMATSGIFISFFVGTSSVLQSVQKFHSEYNVEEGVFITEEAIPHISDIEYEEMAYGEYRNRGKTLRIFKVREDINQHQVTGGKDIKNDYEILIDANYMGANNLQIGNPIEVNQQSLMITGTAISPDYITTKNSDLILQANAEVFGIGFVNEETFDSLFSQPSKYFAYITNELNVVTVADLVEPFYINDSRNNTRIQQVIGDAEAPRDLALLLTLLLFLIVTVLLSVYHFEVSKKERNNLDTFYKLGFKKWTLFKHYTSESNTTLFIAWLLGSVLGMLFIDTIMQMNSQIYNYPLLMLDVFLLLVCLGASFVFLFVLNTILVYYFYIKIEKARQTKSPKGKQGPSWIRRVPFVYRYRLKRMNRNKKEVALFITLIFFVGFLVNFSFLLKDSVSVYVDNLATDNTFEEILFYNPLFDDYPEGEEEFSLYNLFDDDGITQSIYTIFSDSKFYHYGMDLNDGDVIITNAFADKYGKSIGDTLRLHDIANEKEYALEINKINPVTTVSQVYIVSDDEDVFSKETHATNAIANSESFDDINNESIEATLTHKEIITSGENILDVIDKQITLILSLAIVLQVALLYSLFEFSFQNSRKSIKTLKLQGYSLNELVKMHFSFNFLIGILSIISSYLLSRAVVRIFLDHIMFEFVNFVKVTDSLAILLLSNGMIIAIFIFFVLNMRLKIKTV